MESVKRATASMCRVSGQRAGSPFVSRRSLSVFLGAAFALATIVADARPAEAQKARATATATSEKGFGRLILAFQDRSLLPQFTTKTSNGVLVLQFAEPVDIDIDRVPTALPALVTVARRDPDGNGLRFALARQVRINTMEAGEKLFIDFLPGNWAGPPPALPPDAIADLARRAEAALRAQREAEKQRFGVKVLPKVDFRVGRHPTFSRLSFGWNVPFDAQLTREDQKVTLTFSRLAELDLSPVFSDHPPLLREIAADNSSDKLSVMLTVAPEADIRGFREDQTYVLDIVGTGQQPAQGDEAALKKAIEQARGALPPGSKGVMMAPGQREAAPSPAAVAPGSAVDVRRAAVEPPKIADTDLPASTETPAGTPPKTDAPVRPIPSGAADQMPGGEMRPEAKDPKALSVPMVRAEAQRIGNVTRIAFPFPNRVAGAAFQRGDSLWLVFDSTTPMDLRGLTALGPLAREVANNRSEAGQTVRIQLSEPQLTTLVADGNSWILTIGEVLLEATRPLRFRREFHGTRLGSLKIDLPDAGQVHELIDPVIGDKIFVVTAQGPARGLLKPSSFSEVDMLASAHGVAVVPKTDDVQVGLNAGIVTIARDSGLSLSTAGRDPTPLEVPKAAKKAQRKTIDPAMFGAHDPVTFNDRVRSLIRTILEAPAQEKNIHRLELAEFYVANRFGPEAIGVMRLIAKEEPGIERDPGFITLYAAAQTMLGRAGPALKALERTEVAESPDAALWRTIAAAAEQKWDVALAAAGRAEDEPYPADIRALFHLAAAEAATELNDFNTAQARLAEIQPDEIERDLRARYEILEARVLDAAGRSQDALERLKRATDTGDRRAAAEAEYRRLRILMRDGKIEAGEAMERLKSLAFGWRGDEIELQVLSLLANLQVEYGDYRDAFQLMRSATMVDPEAGTTRQLQDEMGREFVSLFLDRKADRMSPVDALAIYYDFRELTPVGRLGDEIVRQLADRLVGVDLLDQAVDLLTHQIDNRMRGAARAQIGADLAAVYLLDRKPDRAIAILNKTRQSQLPVSVERQRRLVEARALSETGRVDLALELIDPLIGADVERLEADILWKGKRWQPASEKIETMLGGRWNDAVPLSDQERQAVLRAAIGYTFASDSLGLERLRTKFAAKMKDSPNAATFDVVTAPLAVRGTEFRDVAREIAALDTLTAFMDEYRNTYLKGPTPAPTEKSGGDPAQMDRRSPDAKAEGTAETKVAAK